MSTLAVIPARLGATRLPRKPLRLLGGTPLVIRVWQRALALSLAERVLIATDHPDVVAVAREAGAECVMTSASHPSGTDRVAEVAGMREYAGYDVIVNIQGDEPFVPMEAVRGASNMVTSGRFALGTASAPASRSAFDDPNVVKVVCADDGRALYFSRAPIPFLRDQADAAAHQPLVRQHIGVYAYTRAALAAWVALPPHSLERAERLEQLRPLAAGMPIGVAPVREMLTGGIDTEDDLRRANERWLDLIAERV